MLRGVDLAAFAVALVARLRRGGVVVAASGSTTFVQAMRQLAPQSRTQLYWAARLTLVNRADDLAAFDAVFEIVFGNAVLGLDPVGMKHRSAMAAGPESGEPGQSLATGGAGGLPWAGRVTPAHAPDGREPGVVIPDALPSHLVGRVDESFDRFEPDDLQLLGSWLEQAMKSWPRRRSLRRKVSPHGKRIDLRETMRRSRRTGWESVILARTKTVSRPRRVVLLCDVSRSMRPYATIYLHLMRAAALRQAHIRPEVFAFSTSLTRLTAVLSHRSPEVALARANAVVADRYGGTHLGRCVTQLLAPPHGNALRGAVVIIASDGWDSDPPEVLDHAMARLRRRAERLVWLNPRAAAPGFQPLAASMAAALPYCDLFLPANSVTGLGELFSALA
jgi:uncharacterized protein with von Willebrand factor type A (vWA) domain